MHVAPAAYSQLQRQRTEGPVCAQVKYIPLSVVPFWVMSGCGRTWLGRWPECHSESLI